MPPYDPDLSRADQTYWASTEYAAWERTVPADRILVTPGNHDWVCRFPEECRSEMYIDELVTIDGKTFYFTPWVSNQGGQWNYELDRGRRRDRFADIPYKVDLLVMHAPAFGCGDMTKDNEPVGCHELRSAIYKKQPKRAVFGHIHEGQRHGKEYRLAGTKLYHCSMWGNGWKPVEFDIN